MRRGLIDERAHEADERSCDRGHRPPRRVARGAEERGDRARERARGTIEHGSEVLAEIAQKTRWESGAGATQQRIDVRAREVRGHAQELRECAHEDADRDPEKGHQRDRAQNERPALEDRIERHRPLALSCSAILSAVVAAHGKNTGVRALSFLKVASQSFCPVL